MTLVVVLTVAEYLVKVCYSPAAFTYADELMHWRTTTDVMQTGKLFTANNLLPISPYYPGLEEVTSALASITGLSVFTSGLIVAGLAHLLFVCVLFVLFRYVSGSHRVAGVALLLYSSESLFQSFDSMFVYQTLALPFLGLTVLAVYRLAAAQAPGRLGWFTVGALSAFATVVTHHVASYLLVATLEVITLGALLARDRRLVAWASILALVSAAAFGAWIVFVAPSTVGYLQPVIDGALQNLRALLAGGHSGVPPPASAARRAAGEPGAVRGGRPDHVGAGARRLVAGLAPVPPQGVAGGPGDRRGELVCHRRRPPVRRERQRTGRTGVDVRIPAGRVHRRPRRDPLDRQQPALAGHPRERAAAGACRRRCHGGGRGGAGSQRAGQRLAAVLGAAAGAITRSPGPNDR